MKKEQSEKKIEMNGRIMGGGKMLICISSRPADLEELRTDAVQCKADKADMIEWRADFFRPLMDADQENEDVSEVAQVMAEGLKIWAEITDRIPMMVCLRRFEEGGAYPYSSDFRLRVLTEMVKTGLVDMVDIEMEESAEFKQKIAAILHENNVQLIYSEHDWKGLPNEEHAVNALVKMQEEGTDIAKYCFIIKDAQDAVTMARVGKRVKEEGLLKVPADIYALGEVGLFNRITADAFGVDYMYCTIRGTFEGGAEESTENYRGIRNYYIDGSYKPARRPVAVKTAVIGGAKPSVAVTLKGKDRIRLLQEAEKAMEYNPDVFEWRIDYYTALINGTCILNILKDTLKLLSETVNGKPVILSFPTMQQGGFKYYSDEVRLAVIGACLETGCVDIVDLGIREAEAYQAEIRAMAGKAGAKLMLSDKDFYGTASPEEILSAMNKAQSDGADLVKLVYTASQPTDTIAIGKALGRMYEYGIEIPAIAYAMNDSGFVSRILAERAGSALGFFTADGACGGREEDVQYYAELKKILAF